VSNLSWCDPLQHAASRNPPASVNGYSPIA